MRALLDVNVLLALVDGMHPHHGAARRWWLDNRSHGWSSCPLTQNGFLRILSQPSYANAVTLREAFGLLQAATASPAHEFWPDDPSLLDQGLVDRAGLLGHRQLADVYLLALAVTRGGRLATLDGKIPLRAVKGARAEHVVSI